MKKFLFILVACVCLLTTSCVGISRQVASNYNVAQTNVVLTKKNYKVLGEVSGESTQNYWCGFGGMSKKSLESSAMSEMYRNAKLDGKSRAVINVSVVYKNKFILIHNQTRCIATGTLIEFTE